MSSGKRLKRRAEFNEILDRWQEFYDYNSRLLIKHLYQLGYSTTKIARILDLDPSNVGRRYPKPEDKGGETS